MKRIVYLLLVTFFLTACSSARPVIRIDESRAMKSQANQEDSAASGDRNSTGSTRGAMATMASTSAPSTEAAPPNQIISASEKELGSVQSADPENTSAGADPPDPAAKAPDTAASQTPSPQTAAPQTTAASDVQKSEASGGSHAELIDEPVQPKVSDYNLFDYYPLIPDQRIVLTGELSGESSLILQYLYEEQGKATAQIKQTASSGSRLNVVRITRDQISDLYYSVEVPYRDNIIGWADYQERIILKAPLVEGNRWESTGLRFEIVAVDQTRTIGEEEQTVMDVHVTNGTERIQFTYAVGIGLVSNDRINPDGTLTNIVRFAGLKELATDDYPMEFFFPGRDGNFRRIPETIQFGTNEMVKDRMTEVYQLLAEEKDQIPVLGEKTKIQYLFKDNNLLHVDLNEAFITSVDRAPELEDERIQCLVNTLSSFYQAEGVILTINDQRYESANRKIESDEILVPTFPLGQ